MQDVLSIIVKAMHRDILHNLDKVLNSEIWLHGYMIRHHHTSPPPLYCLFTTSRKTRDTAAEAIV